MSGRRTVAAKLDHFRIPGELQLDNDNRFGTFSTDDYCRRHGPGGHRHRDSGAASRSIVFIYVPRGIEIVVVMDGRTVVMIAILPVFRNGVNVESQRLRL